MKIAISLMAMFLMLGSCADETDKVVEPELKIVAVAGHHGFEIYVAIQIENRGSVVFEEIGALTSSKKGDPGFEIQTPIPGIVSANNINNQGYIPLNAPGVYYVRPYGKDSNGKFYEGEEMEVNTGAVMVDDFSPKIGGAGVIIEIKGMYLSNGIIIPEVWIGEVKAEVQSAEIATITAKVPLGIVVSPVKVVVKTLSGEFILPGELEWRKGVWTKMPDYTGSFLTDNLFSFSLNESGYVGMNVNDKKIWKYNTLTGIWSESSTYPGELCVACRGFQFQNGIPAFITRSNQEWWYISDTNSWIEKSPFPAPTAGSVAFTFTVGSESYVGKYNISGSTVSVWKKQPTDATWTQLSDCPYPISSSVSLVLNGMTYIIGGIYSDKNQVWRYDPTLDEWTQMTDGPFESRKNAVGFVIGNKIYFGGGEKYVSSGEDTGRDEYLLDFYEYTPATDQWVRVQDFPNPDPGPGLGGVFVSFMIEERGYVIRGEHQFYRFEME